MSEPLLVQIHVAPYVPFDRTKRSLLNQSGLWGAYTMAYFQRATPMAAMPIAPLWKKESDWELTCCALSRKLDSPWVAHIILLAQVRDQDPICPEDNVVQVGQVRLRRWPLLGDDRIFDAMQGVAPVLVKSCGRHSSLYVVFCVHCRYLCAGLRGRWGLRDSYWTGVLLSYNAVPISNCPQG